MFNCRPKTFDVLPKAINKNRIPCCFIALVLDYSVVVVLTWWFLSLANVDLVDSCLCVSGMMSTPVKVISREMSIYRVCHAICGVEKPKILNLHATLFSPSTVWTIHMIFLQAIGMTWNKNKVGYLLSIN